MSTSTRNFELKGRVICAMKRIGRPATAAEIQSMGLSAAFPVADVRFLLDELAIFGFLLVEDRTEAFNPGRLCQSRRVARRYYSLPPEGS
jgi:hypothetical protein